VILPSQNIGTLDHTAQCTQTSSIELSPVSSVEVGDAAKSSTSKMAAAEGTFLDDHSYCSRNNSTRTPTNLQDCIVESRVFCSNNATNLRFVLLNVCGLRSKSLFPELVSFINNYDCVCFVETKCDMFDCISFDGYKCFSSTRKNRSGGIMVCIRDKYAKGINQLEGLSENVLWLLFESVFDDFKLLLGCAYVSPEGSGYSSLNSFDEIENDIINFAAAHENMKICLTGDFNAKTACENDLIEFDHDLFDAIDVSVNSIDPQAYNRNKHPIPRRVSCDKALNNFGYRLLELCKSCDVCILNGRMGEQSGNLTCKNASVVDYFVVSTDLLPFCVSVDVHEFDPLLSDVHCPVSLCMSLEIDNACIVDVHKHKNTTDSVNSGTRKSKWDIEMKQDFIDNFDIRELEVLCTEMDNVDNEVSIDEIVSRLNDVIITAAEKSSLIIETKPGTRKVKHDQKPWFNKECAIKRKEYHKAKCKNWHLRSENAKEQLVCASKAYKKILNKQFHSYQKAIVKKIRNLESSCPKDYWNLINKGENHRSTANSITSEIVLDHFKKLNTGEDVSDFRNIPTDQIPHNNFELNRGITEAEIVKAILSLKNNKACSSDLILNEFLKAAQPLLVSVLVRLFNLILDKGLVPSSWSDGFIVPIYKNKGDCNNPDNYRGITILSCLGKLFTSVLNNRLNEFIVSYNLLGEEQAGFRKNYSTTDHMFNLKCLIDMYLCKKKRLFCAFIDYKKAFDSVDRIALWQKLLRHGIDGKFLVLVRNMYDQAKSCVKTSGTASEFFQSNVGLRQGENLSPVLFSLFLNDLTDFIAKAYDGLEHVTELAHDALDTKDVEHYLKLFVLLYADDTVILAESAAELQSALNSMYLYCKSWNLQVNPAKTKVVIFSKTKVKDPPSFVYDGNKLDVDDDFLYLGVTFNHKGTFSKTRAKLVQQARRAMFSLLKKARKLGLPADLQLKLFDKTIVPILLYGAEVWGFENLDIIEAFHFKFCKTILGLKASTPKVMVYGELGRIPLSILVKVRMIKFWSKLLPGSNDKLSGMLYRIMLHLDDSGRYHSQWLHCIRVTLQNCGLAEQWSSQFTIDNSMTSKCVQKILTDQYIQKWLGEVDEMSKCLNYRLYKKTHCVEKYFSILSPDLSRFMCRFRCMNHRLPIEYGRFIRLERGKRTCKLCTENALGDEFHYLFKCSFFNSERERYLSQVSTKSSNTLILCELMNTQVESTMVSIATFCKKVIQYFDAKHKKI
jgi:hypothetical protein